MARRSTGQASRQNLTLLLAGAAALLALAGAYLWLLGGTAPPPRDAIGGAWTLTSDEGRTVTDRTFRGRYALMYFGYTGCPDICPTTLAAMAEATRRLGPLAAQVQPIFITVDPDRDTPAVLARYLRSFGASIIGLTGSQTQIHAVLAAYRIEAIPQAGGAIDHTSVLLLIGPDGGLRTPLPATDGAGPLALAVRNEIQGRRP